MTSEDCVKKFFPDAYLQDDDFLCKVFIDKNGLGNYESISSNLTEDQAWDDAWDWIKGLSDYELNKLRNRL